MNSIDISGLKKKQQPLPSELYAPCFWRGPDYGPEALDFFRSELCGHYRTAYFNKKPSIYWDFKNNGTLWYEPKASRARCPGAASFVAQNAGVGGYGRALAGIDPVKNIAVTTGENAAFWGFGKAWPLFAKYSLLQQV